MLKARRDRYGFLRCGVSSVVLLSSVLLNASVAIGQPAATAPAKATATATPAVSQPASDKGPPTATTATGAAHASPQNTASAPSSATGTASSAQTGTTAAPSAQPQPNAASPSGNAASATGVFAEQRAEEDDAVATNATREPPKKPPESTRWLLMGVGVGTTALAYAGALGIRELWPSQAHRTDLQYPVAGPFMDLAHTGCPSWNASCSKFQLVVRTLLVTLDAIGQAGGVALVLQGAVLSTSSGESPPSATTTHSQRRRTERTATAIPMPWFDQTGGGIGLVGQF